MRALSAVARCWGRRQQLLKKPWPWDPIVRISIIDAPEQDDTVRFEVGEQLRLALMTSSLPFGCAVYASVGRRP